MLTACLVGLGATWAMLGAFARVARHVGLVDRPGGRKHHQEEVPLVGGLAIIGGFTFGVLCLAQPLGSLRPLFCGILLMLVIGVLDDFQEIGARARLLWQSFAALLVVTWGQIQLHDFGALFGHTFVNGWLTIPLTVFCIVGVINALNMADGVDGLAASAALVALGTASWLMGVGSPLFGPLSVLLVCLGAFWIVNARLRRARPAPVFLGDAGSMTLGLVIAATLIQGSQGADAAFAPVTALWLFALPLLDTVYVMIRRIQAGRSPLAGGRDHFHHLFLRAGFSDQTTFFAYLGLALTGAGIGVLLEQLALPEVVRFAAFLALSAAYYRVLTTAWTRQRWCGRALTPG